MEALIELLSNPEKVQIVLQSISGYVVYIYPGIISIYWNNFLEAKTSRETQSLVIKSFSISYLYNIVLGSILSYENNAILYNIIIIIMSIFFPFLYNKLKYSSIVATVCDKLGIRTCLSSVPFELLKNRNESYTCLKIYLNDEKFAYVGYLKNYEYEENSDKFVILSSCKKYELTCNEEKLIIDNQAYQDVQKVFIKYDDIKVIEKIAENIANTQIYGT
ncbi:MAG: hypothetical protein J1F42_01740 [Lachnospiraceae bacterium]|nr:hypothetical protein [Lachnospiraceae bacterium]